ncbi:tetratricopeptide repeat protein [Ferrimonas sp.]|uniref:tetratricopeptide repeat protein n=1 Tax=Ferrimonas sp. TaxID=2080861 RepID=UPI003A91C9C5
MNNPVFANRTACLGTLLVLWTVGCSSRSYIDFHDERHGRVIAEATVRLEANPEDPELFATRGRAYFCTRQYHRAITDFSRAIALDPDNANAYRGRGRARRIIDHQALATGAIISAAHPGFVADTDKANRLDPARYEAEVNQGFGYFSETSGEFLYPIRGYCIDGVQELRLGSTTANQAAQLLPLDRFTSHGARRFLGKRSQAEKPRIGKVGPVVDRVRSFYEIESDSLPSPTLIFDQRDRLVVIRNVDSMFTGTVVDRNLGEAGNERMMRIEAERLEKYHALMRSHRFTEVYRDEKHPEYGDRYSNKTLRAELTPCVILDITLPIILNSGFVIYDTEYIYVCPTN